MCANSANGPLLPEKHVQLAESVAERIYSKLVLIFYKHSVCARRVNITREIKPRGLRPSGGARERKKARCAVRLKIYTSYLMGGACKKSLQRKKQPAIFLRWAQNAESPCMLRYGFSRHIKSWKVFIKWIDSNLSDSVLLRCRHGRKNVLCASRQFILSRPSCVRLWQIVLDSRPNVFLCLIHSTTMHECVWQGGCIMIFYLTKYWPVR